MNNKYKGGMNMKLIELLRKILKNLKTSIKRFPVTIGISVACVILLIYLSELGYDGSNNLKEIIKRIVMVLALGIPLSLSIKLIFERLEKKKKIQLFGSYLIGVIALILYYVFLLESFNMIPITRYTGVSLMLYLSFLTISYLPNRDNFERYIIKILGRFFTTVIYSLVLFLGLSAILFTIDRLLGVSVKGEIYYYCWLIVVGVFAVTFFLAGIPQYEDNLNDYEYPKVIKVLILYIVMPLISVYTLILYIYFGKIIITTQWPQGLVSHLVLWYSAISAFILFLITPLVKHNIWAKRFMEIFPKVIIPLVIMMFFSIGIRINAYGVTENRYYVVALALWILLIMLYFSKVKKYRNIILPISLAVIIFISIFGPISSYSVSKFSQNKRLEKILLNYDMINNNSVVKSNKIIPEEDMREISSIIRYFDMKHDLSELKYFPKDFKIDKMESILGFKYYDEYYNNGDNYFFLSSRSTNQFVDIRGYDYLFDGRNQGFKGDSTGEYALDFNYETNMLKIKQSSNEIYSKDLTVYINNLIDKYGYSKTSDNVPASEMSFEDENEDIKIKIQLVHLSGMRELSTGKIQSKGIEFYILIKNKK